VAKSRHFQMRKIEQEVAVCCRGYDSLPCQYQISRNE